MEISRKKFLVNGAILTGALATGNISANILAKKNKSEKNNFPIIISTWSHGLLASKKALEILNNNGSLLDAITGGINLVENDPANHSVGLGGFPDASGNVTLDASIMDKNGNCGSVAALQDIKNPINVAQLVMEKSKHVFLVSEGAKQFAINSGMKTDNLLTPEMKKTWEKWRNSQTKEMLDPVLGSDKNHDTIGLLAIDKNGDISGGVSTSGWAYKLPGRVGDSPIIGAGLYVDNNIGAACSTGLGERVIETVGSFLIVEKMREGYPPLDAIKIAVERLVERVANKGKFQVAYIAINKSGEHAGYALRDGFEYAVTTNKTSEMLKTDFHLK